MFWVVGLMIKQVIEVSHPSRISAKDRQLVIEQTERVVRTPIEDLGVLLLAHPQITVTQFALAQCQGYGIVVVVCNESYLPTGFLLPLLGGSLHAETLRIQVAASKAVTGEVWRQIIKAKISSQAQLLAVLGKPSSHLEQMVGRVMPDDKHNLEAQAAQHYWPILMGDGFHRQNTSSLNSILNYGYAVVRAAIARAVVGSGLHPAWGVFHHNRSDNFALVDDLLEPLRVGVDYLAWGCRNRSDVDLTPELKKSILSLLSAQILIGGQALPLWVALQRYVASLKAMLSGETKQLEIPRWAFSADTERCG